ncbi:MAG TPA: hypothetical protein VGG90_10815 [Candidatus Dormibacteraeota bacterium]|jgi:hypothetical protein
MARRILTAAGIVAGLIVAGTVAFVAYTALNAPLGISFGQSAVSPENCSPGPCADVQGYRLWVSNVRVESDLVRMTVKFQNSSSSTHASPEDLQLIDASRSTSGVVTSAAGCNTWPRHEFANGATFGPIDVCFHVSNPTPPFTMRWTPDLGLFCCDTSIKITPT